MGVLAENFTRVIVTKFSQPTKKDRNELSGQPGIVVEFSIILAQKVDQDMTTILRSNLREGQLGSMTVVYFEFGGRYQVLILIESLVKWAVIGYFKTTRRWRHRVICKNSCCVHTVLVNMVNFPLITGEHHSVN